MTFVTVNRFCFLQVYINSPPLFLMENIKLNGIQTKIKWKILVLFTLHFKIYRCIILIKIYKIEPPVLLFAIPCDALE